MIRKQTFAVGVIAALLGLGAMTLGGCGGAAKQTNTTTTGTGTNNSGGGAESQPSR